MSWDSTQRGGGDGEWECRQMDPEGTEKGRKKKERGEEERERLVMFYYKYSLPLPLPSIAPLSTGQEAGWASFILSTIMLLGELAFLVIDHLFFSEDRPRMLLAFDLFFIYMPLITSFTCLSMLNIWIRMHREILRYCKKLGHPPSLPPPTTRGEPRWVEEGLLVGAYKESLRSVPVKG